MSGRCPGCGKQIAATSTACFRCWTALPAGLRRKINKQLRVTGDRAHPNVRVQMAKAQRVWAEADLP